MAPTSYAIPRTLNKSPLFEVNSKSITSSSKPRYLIGFSPIGALLSNSQIPSISSSFKNLWSKPNSASEHNIPLEVYPLIVDFFIVPPGNVAPSRAVITFKPSLTFGAPHIISNISLPIFTLHKCK